MSKKKDTSIPTWTIFGTRSIGLEIHAFDDDAKKRAYQLALTIFLDDGKEAPTEHEQQKVITIFTDLQSYDLDSFVFESASWVAAAFENIGNHVFVLNETGDIEKEITLDLFMKNYNPKSKKKSAKENNGATFH